MNNFPCWKKDCESGVRFLITTWKPRPLNTWLGWMPRRPEFCNVKPFPLLHFKRATDLWPPTVPGHFTTVGPSFPAPDYLITLSQHFPANVIRTVSSQLPVRKSAVRRGVSISSVSQEGTTRVSLWSRMRRMGCRDTSLVRPPPSSGCTLLARLSRPRHGCC